MDAIVHRTTAELVGSILSAMAAEYASGIWETNKEKSEMSRSKKHLVQRASKKASQGVKLLG